MRKNLLHYAINLTVIYGMKNFIKVIKKWNNYLILISIILFK